MRVRAIVAAILITCTVSGCGNASPKEDLFGASTTCDLQEAKQALASKADVNSTEDVGHETPLMLASFNGCSDVVRALLAAGADVNAKVPRGFLSGETALILGSGGSGANAATVEVLIAAGGNVNAIAPRGETPLKDAARYGKVDIVKDLVAAGASINERGDGGLSPLAEALFAGSEMAQNANFGTPKDHAAVADFLRAHGGLDIGRPK